MRMPSSYVLEKLAAMYTGVIVDDYITPGYLQPEEIPYKDLKKYYREYLNAKSAEPKTPLAEAMLRPGVVGASLGAIGGFIAGLDNPPTIGKKMAIGATGLGGLLALVGSAEKLGDDNEIEKAKQLVTVSDTSDEFKKALNEELESNYYYYHNFKNKNI